MKIYSLINRFVSLLLVAALLLCCVPALAVPAAAVDTEMYLYNGVELPDINTVWTDKVSYPYAGIRVGNVAYLGLGLDINEPVYELTLLSQKPYLKDFDTLAFTANWSFVSYYLIFDAYACNSVNAALGRNLFIPATWVPGDVGSNRDYEIVFFSADGFAWSSADILDANGTICFAASDPVPVNFPSSISSVSILSPDIVQAGLYIAASVDVAGTGDFDSSATLTLSGNASSGTYLKKGAYGNNWTLYCGSDETASKLTLTAASVQDSSVTASKTITVGQSGVDPTDPTIPSDPDDPDPSDPTVPEETQPGNSGSLTDKSGDISDGLGDIHDFEQSQKDVLDNNMDTILFQVDFVNLIPALAFVGGYINKAWLSMSAIQLIFIVPLFLGIFYFICSRVPGSYLTGYHIGGKFSNSRYKGKFTDSGKERYKE